MVWAVFGLVLLAIGGLCLAAAFIPATSSQVDEFTRAYELTPGPTARRMIRHQLTVSRRVRNLLIVDILVLPPLFTAAFFGSGGLSIDLTTVLLVVLACAIVGAAITELLVTRPAASSTRRIAVLIPREPATYLSRPMRWWPPLGAVATVAALLVHQIGEMNRAADAGAPQPSSSSAVIGSLVVMAVPLGCVLVSRWIVRRPQPFVSDDLVEADDALREATIRRIFGLAGTTVGLSLATTLLVLGIFVDSAALGTVTLVGALGSGAAAMLSFRSRHRRFPAARRRRSIAA